MGPHDYQHLAPGTVVEGKYRIEKVIGAGGMGVVVKATHLLLDEAVAMKFLRPEYAGDPAASARFLREARAAIRIKGEHVARMLDADTLPGGAPYIVMEYLEGCDLEQLLGQRGPMPPSEAVDAIIHACAALGDAHARGVIHRDLKPANLFRTVGPSGQAVVKILDFGISKITDGVDRLTRTQTTMGSALYMSPEQLKSSRDVDGRTDIYALGVTLFQLLSGHFPFLADTMPQTGRTRPHPAPSGSSRAWRRTGPMTETSRPAAAAYGACTASRIDPPGTSRPARCPLFPDS